ncbi:fungal hydrophobin [Pluteus cervinus]|uniref:Fungal hydrophobin n=1 Tax=Pluteus cervinus TaxID=181527 RepID=A0ACD3AGP8_9AGAR|nr:fungal hydrophobin [Pluteus cervinus]
MFSKLAIIAAATMAVFVAATPIPTDGDAGQCNTGSIQCCNSVHSAGSSGYQVLSALMGANVGSITGMIGADCSPISAIGAGGNSCSSQPMCCQNNNYNGLVVVGCTPININA